MRILIAVLLCPLLTLPSAAQDIPKPTIQEQVVRIAQGAAVEVRLSQGNEKLRGRMGDVATDGFTLQIAQGSQMTNRPIAFSEVKAIKTAGKHSTAKTVFATIGVIWVVLTVITLIAYKGKLD
jgi:hypothetical protein